MTKQPFCFSLLLLICVSIPLMATAQTVNIPDGKLRAAVEKALGKASGDPISVEEMATLTNLTAQKKKIRNLTGLESASNLKKLRLANNRISNISPVAGLTKLTELQLPGNRITDISSVEGLTRLKKLYLKNNRITDISSLVANTGFGRGDLVSLQGNPLSAESINTHIPALQGREVTVRFDAPEPVDNVVNIPDANLRARIERALGKTAGATITPAEMATLTKLTAQRANINDLTGLEHATNLTDLDLHYNSISDISAVAGLTNLTDLDLSDNSISDISAVAGLINLTDLDLRDNSVSDISAVAGLINLTDLALYNNSVSDISAVAGLTNLTSLDLRSNSISDISAVAGLTNLTYLYLHYNSISDISAVAGLTNLRILILSSNSISDISAVADLTNLTHLYLEDNSVSDISAVAGLTNLRILILYNNSISDISAVAGLKLTDLYLHYNSISDISAVAGLTNLRTLYLHYNSISDISAVAGLTKLTDLSLEGNSISDISAVAGLTKLTDLYLRNNIISDISAVVSNTGLGSRDEVDVRGNPLSDVSMNTHIPALESRGVKVLWSATAAAPAMTRIAPVLGVNGAIDGQTARLNTFRVTVKNLSNGKAATGLTTNADGVGYQLTIVAVATGQAAAIDDILEISAQSPDPSIAVQPIRYTVTAEDVKRGWIQLEALVAYKIPAVTELLPNYPNPFNPETWIPYRLAEDAFVTLTIYDRSGQVVRTFDVGHRRAAVYESRSKAIYWDGRNEIGEQVTSSVYFYHLSAGDYSATRKMLILK